jgi:predicted amidohydrolase
VTATGSDDAMAPRSVMVAIVQMTPRPGEVDVNLARVERFLAESSGAGAGLVCLPELCLSGYLLDRDTYTPALLGEAQRAVTQLRQWAQQAQVSVILGCPRLEGDRLLNSVLLLGAHGEILVYDKIHLDRRERSVFAAGDALVVHDDGVGIACCYDIAFPELGRALALNGALALMFPMAWETRRDFVVRRVRAARAVENIAYVVCANQVGQSGPYRFAGGSCIIDPLGNVVCALGDAEGWAVAELDLAGTQRMRTADDQTYPFLEDRRLPSTTDEPSRVSSIESRAFEAV